MLYDDKYWNGAIKQPKIPANFPNSHLSRSKFGYVLKCLYF
jgi:hypothetical protein